MNHRLFVNLLDTNNHDTRWAYSMDIAISKAILAIKSGLDEEEINFLRFKFLTLLPKINETEALEQNALIYYTQYFPDANVPWNSRDICDFILALSHRIYSFKYNLNKWENSSFKCVPVGLPRTKNVSKNARNYTQHTTGIYQKYNDKVRMGKMFESSNIFIYKDNYWVRENRREDKIELTETNETHWLHTRISNIPKIWVIIERLFQVAIKSNNLDEIVGIVAQIHWWLSQGMPYRRGSAAVSDMFTKVIFQYHNIPTSNWKKGIAPDLEAFCLPLEKYLHKYNSFFEKSFKDI